MIKCGKIISVALSAVMAVSSLGMTVATAETPVTTPAIIQDDILCSLTVHKYIMDRHITYQREYSVGHELTQEEIKGITDNPVNGAPLDEIQFRAYPLDEDGNKMKHTTELIAEYTYNYAEKYSQAKMIENEDSTKLEKTDVDVDTAAELVKMFTADDEGYVSVLSEPTDQDGVTTFTNLFQGEWLVEEMPSSKVASKAVPMKIILPFTADNSTDWQYDAHAYPKNTDISIEKDVQHLGNDHHTARINEEHEWIITTTLPDDLNEYIEYKVVDPIDERLDFVGVTKVCAVQNSITDDDQGDETELSAEDYVITEPTAENNNTLTIELTEQGRKNICPLGGKVVEATKFRVYFETKIDKELEVENFGVEIPNKGYLDFTNSFGEEKQRESDEPEVHTAAISVYKYDADTELPLAGAKFKIANSKENAIDGVFMKDADGIDDYVIVTGEDGYAMFEGITFGTQASAQGEEPVVKGQEINDSQTTYWIVEVEAPVDAESGVSYQLCEEPIEVIANSNSHKIENCVSVENKIVLIKTGDEGTLPFRLIGITIAGCAMFGITLLVAKKRKIKNK